MMSGFGSCPHGGSSFGAGCSEVTATSEEEYRYLRILLRGMPLDVKRSNNSILSQMITVLEAEDIELGGAVVIDNIVGI